MIEGFYGGYETLTCKDHDVMAKSDGDLFRDPTHSRSLVDESFASPKLGTAGGETGSGVPWANARRLLDSVVGRALRTYAMGE